MEAWFLGLISFGIPLHSLTISLIESLIFLFISGPLGYIPCITSGEPLIVIL
jgi:hypothetical protein